MADKNNLKVFISNCFGPLKPNRTGLLDHFIGNWATTGTD